MKKIISFLIVFIQASLLSCQNSPNKDEVIIQKEVAVSESKTPKMKVEVWSDIMCPFCYIGKRHFEAALEKFEHAQDIELVWHSYQLDPTLPKLASKLNAYQYLAQHKGISYEESVAMHKNVIDMAKEAGLNYNYDKVVVANSFDAHRLIQLAKKHGKGNEVEERLFKAYFIEGKNMSDISTLILLGKEIGLDETIVKAALNSSEFANEVNNDINEASQLGVQGVPFFIFNRKYAISGAEPVTTFLETITKSYNEWKVTDPAAKLEVIKGKVCKPNNQCK
jgi:predicted DsbA family dithiol-disulfide isomerase